MKKWDVQQFSVKSLDYVEELQHPREGWSTVHRKPSMRPCNVFGERSCHRDAMSKRAWSWHHRSTVLTPSTPRRGIRQCADVIPLPSPTPRVFLQAGSRSCSSLFLPLPRPPPSAVAQVMICGSQDWLATWGRHCVMTRGPVGVWLSRQRPLTMCCRAVPLGFHFCRERAREKGTTSSLSFGFCRKHRCPCTVSGLYYCLLINDVYQHRRFMLAGE